jgi:hypothetical protein
MRTPSRALVILVGLLLIGAPSAPIFANNLPVGTFTLSHPVLWNGTMLPAGVYHFKMMRTQTDVNMLVISGEKKTLNLTVFSQSACDSCKTEGLTMTVQGNSRVVTALDLPGYHIEFETPRMENAKETVSDSTPWSEQVDVHTNPEK